MTDRLTDTELDYLDGYMWASPSRKQTLALIAEVREHRAARTLSDLEQGTVDYWRRLQWPGHARSHLLAIIDRITDEADRG